MRYNVTVDIAEAKHRHARTWRNKKKTWDEIVKSLSVTVRTPETLKEFLKFPKEKQDDVKDVGGFVGGYLKDGRRLKGNVVHRQIVALDIDDTDSLDIWLGFQNLEAAGAMYTTHKHTRQAPRFRLVFPLDRAVSPDEYEAIGRIVASWLGMDEFDDTTYQPSRLMHYPSTSKDGEFIADNVDAPILIADEILAELPDWRDVTTWPMSSREIERGKIVGRHADKEAELPEDKPGLIGAFCRAYGIEDAIDEFIPDVYSPCARLGEGRYTYVEGSSSGGLIVYDNRFAYSHHSTDPISGRLVNSFDMVRLHKFGDLDDPDKVEGKDVTKAPSYKAMVEFAGNLSEVKRELLQARRGSVSSDDYDDIEEEARERAHDSEWLKELEMERNAVKNTIANVVLILNNDAQLSGRFGFNEFEQRETAIGRLPWDRRGTKYPRPLADSDDAELRLYFERVYGITGRGQILDGLTVVLRGNSYHPIKQYLDALEWDGVERLEELFINTLGAPDNEYVRAVTRKSFAAAVARVYNPGVKFDYATILVGVQGIGKSTVLARMGGNWFSDSLVTLVGKEALESIQGSWLIELGELASLRKAEVEAVKQFISKQEDRFRVAYGKRVEHFPRRCVFFGTTNEDDFLRDASGNRRFWVVNTDASKIWTDVWDYMDADTVGQLWAEAKETYEAGEELRLDSKLEAVARGIQDAHLERDDRAGLIAQYLNTEFPDNWDDLDLSSRRAFLSNDFDNQKTKKGKKKHQTCVIEVWAECLGRDPALITRRDSYEIGRAMRIVNGWRPYGALKFPIYGYQKAFIRDV